MKTAVLGLLSQYHNKTASAKVELCHSSLDLSNLLKSLGEEIGDLDYHGLLTTATCIDLDDFVVECVMADSSEQLPVLIRNSGAVSVLNFLTPRQATARFIDIVRTRDAIFSHPNDYIGMRLQGSHD